MVYISGGFRDQGSRVWERVLSPFSQVDFLFFLEGERGGWAYFGGFRDRLCFGGFREASGFGDQGLRAWGLGFRDQGFRVWGFGFRARGLGLGV